MPTRQPETARRRIAQPHVAARFHHGPHDAVPLEHGQGLVHGIALGDSAQVDPHALFEQFDRPVLRLEPEELVTHQVLGLPQGLGRGKFLLPPRPPPEPNHRADGHVEGPVALLRNLLGMFQDLPQFGADMDGLPLPAVSQSRRSSLSGS